MLENRSSADSHVTAYRPDVDGLRAVAVVAVVVYHLAEGVLPGGYLGVDIFFVLSGYLITSIIWREALAGQFSLATFYNRRIRRILPALLLVLAATLALSALILLPIDLVGLGRSALASLAFVANIYFWRDTNYFARIAEEKPLLHIWSLGVEEQFYLLFPLLLAWLARRRQGRAAAVIAGVLLASLAANFALLAMGIWAAGFYLLPTRAWELAAGALLALRPPAGRATAPTPALAWLGAALIALGLATGRTLLGTSVPDGLMAVAGTVLLLHAGSAGSNPVSRALALRGPVFVGLISYSLYLWHWPVIVLLKYYLVRDLTGLESAGAFALAAAAATASWRWVEQPHRSKALPIRSVHLRAAVGSAVVALAGAGFIASDGLPQRLPADAARINAAVGTTYRCPVTDYLFFAGTRACALNSVARDPSAAEVILFGNSYAQMYAPLVGAIFEDRSVPGLLVPVERCTPTLNGPCRKLTEHHLEALGTLPRARTVVVATSWPQRNLPELVKGLDRTLDHLVAADKTVVLVGPLAAPDWDVASRLSRSLAFGRELNKPLFQPRAQFLERYAAVLSHFERRGDITFIRPDRIQCPGDRCEYLMEGRSLFADEIHLSVAELPRFRALFEDAMPAAPSP